MYRLFFCDLLQNPRVNAHKNFFCKIYLRVKISTYKQGFIYYYSFIVIYGFLYHRYFVFMFRKKNKRHLSSQTHRNIAICFVLPSQSVWFLWIIKQIFLNDGWWLLSIAGIVTVIVGYIKLRPTVIRTRAWTPAEEVSILFCVHINNDYIDRK